MYLGSWEWGSTAHIFLRGTNNLDFFKCPKKKKFLRESPFISDIVWIVFPLLLVLKWISCSRESGLAWEHQHPDVLVPLYSYGSFQRRIEARPARRGLRREELLCSPEPVEGFWEVKTGPCPNLCGILALLPLLVVHRVWMGTPPSWCRTVLPLIHKWIWRWCVCSYAAR